MKIFLKKYKNIIQIKQSEKKLFLKLFIHSFLIGVANSFFLVQASNVFISKVNIAEIPIAYIISGFIGLLLINIYKKAQQRFGQIISYELIIFIFFIFTLIIYFGQIYLVDNFFFIKSLAYIGFASVFAFLTLFNVGFAGICSSVFNFSQSKRLIGLLGIGEVMASIIGFLLVPFIVKLTGNGNSLLFFAMIFSLISILPIRKVFKKSVNNVTVDPKIEKNKKFNYRYIIDNPFVFYLSITTIFSIATLYFVDYSYIISIRNYANLSRIETTTIVATIFCIIKAGELFFSLFSSNIIASLGMKKAGLLLPNLLIIGAMLCLFAIIFYSNSPLFIIFFLFLNKFIERVIRKSITVPTRKVMYQINTPEDRIFLQNNIDGTMMQLSTILVGIALYLLCSFTKVTNYNLFLQTISIFNFLIFALFLFFSLRLFKKYQSQIQNFLNNNYKLTSEKNELIPSNEITIKHSEIANEINKEINFSNNEILLSLIIYYNPTASNRLSISNVNSNIDPVILNNLSRLYFENQNYFSRIAILSYINNFDFITKLDFLKNNVNITPLKLRIFLLDNIYNDLNEIPNSYSFFLLELTNSCIQEILWTDSTINDLKNINDSNLLHYLKIHRQDLVNMLLSILKLTHEKKSIDIVKHIINSADLSEEDSFFVCELLENIIKPELKENIIPIFEPITFLSRKNKYQLRFSIQSLKVNDRLLDILMHDFNILDSYIKQLVLEFLHVEKSDTNLINAFNSSQILNLYIASYSNTFIKNDILQRKIDITNKISSYFSLDNKSSSLILRWVFRENSNGKNNNQIDLALSNIYKSSLLKLGIEDELISGLNIDLIAPVLLSKTL